MSKPTRAKLIAKRKHEAVFKLLTPPDARGEGFKQEECGDVIRLTIPPPDDTDKMVVGRIYNLKAKRIDRP